MTTETSRPDGRAGGGTLRPLACEASCLHRADGSAKFSAGQTSVLAAVYGPAAPRVPSRERPHEASIVVVFRHGNRGAESGIPGYGAKERELERFVSGAVSSSVVLEDYPRTVIEIVVQVLKADGGVVGVAVNAVAVALMDAGVAMRSVPIATTCLVDATTTAVKESCADQTMMAHSLRLDPTAEEEVDDGDDGEHSSVVVIVTDSVKRGVISSFTSGTMSQANYLSCIEAASRASKAVLEFMRLAVQQKTTREAQTLWSSSSMS